MYRALDVARYIINRYDTQGKTISNLKLQKILYFVQAEFLVAKNKSCFVDEIEAWDFGPVVPEVYHKYKIFGGSNIPVLGNSGFPNVISKGDQVLVDRIMDACATYPASVLVDITHSQAPWIDAYSYSRNAIISKKSIKDFFKDK